MGQVMCSHQCATDLWLQVLKGYKGYVPPDIHIYSREFVRIFTCIPVDYANEYVRNIVREGVLPTRGELEYFRQNIRQNLWATGKVDG